MALTTTVPTREPPLTPVRCVNEQGFSLHAEVCCAAHQRKKLEQLCRYITRPTIANERLALNRAGPVVLTLKTPYREGTTHIVMPPLEFIQRLAALVPRPRLHLIRFHGVLAPNARLRPHWGQCSISIANTRLSSRAQLTGAGAAGEDLSMVR